MKVIQFNPIGSKQISITTTAEEVSVVIVNAKIQRAYIWLKSMRGMDGDHDFEISINAAEWIISEMEEAHQ